MRILIIPSWYKTKTNPVLGSFFEEQALALTKLGHEVSVFHIGFKSFSNNESPEEYIREENGLFVTSCTYKSQLPKNHRINYYLLNRYAFKQYKKHLKFTGKPDVIHAHSVYYGGLFARYLSAKLKVPFILTEHLTDLITENTISTYDIKLAKEVFLAAKKNLAVSTYFQKALAARFNLPLSTFDVLPNMVDELFYLQFKRIEIRKDNAIVFFSNAFLSERKNIALQLMAFDLFHSKFPHSKLFIGGDSVRAEDKRYHKEMLQLRDSLASKDSITFTGPLSRWEVKKKMDECHVFLLSSKFESFGVVLIEAMACGRPVITTDCKGPDDIVSAENGIIVNTSLPKDFFEAMENVTMNYAKYNQEAIRKETIYKYSGDSISKRLIGIYSSTKKN